MPHTFQRLMPRLALFCLICLFFNLPTDLLIAQCPGSNTGFVTATVAINNASGGTDPWNNPTLALTDNNQYATMNNAALLIGGTFRSSNFLVFRNFNLNIPNNAMICGVQVEIRKASSDNTTSNWTRDLDLRLLKNNQFTGTNHANAGVNWPTTETAFTYGTNADLWGTTLKGFDVNQNGFGVAFAIESRASGLLLPTVISYVDQVRLRVYYHVSTLDGDNDGIDQFSDADIDGDGMPNSGELIFCTTSSPLDITAQSNPTLATYTAASIRVSNYLNITSGAGVINYNISENYSGITGLEFYAEQDIATASDQSVIKYVFETPVYNLSFKMQDIDIAVDQFKDEVTVNAYHAGQLYQLSGVNYVIGPGNFNQYSGNNKFTGLLAMDNTELNGTISINYPGMVDSLMIIYKNIDPAFGFQSLGIGNISFCNPKSGENDPDGDLKSNYLDIDSDGDGIHDIIEFQSSATLTFPSGLDTDSDGLDNAFDVSTGGIQLVAVNTDNEGFPDAWDTDSDNDGYNDLLEGNDANKDCIADFPLSGLDTDNDGLDNAYDVTNGGIVAPIQDTDNDGNPDFRQSLPPMVSDAGEDQTVNSPSATLDANVPGTGLGNWSVLTGTGVFVNIYDPVTTVTGLSVGSNVFSWTVKTDACHVSADNVIVTYEIVPVPVVMGPLKAVKNGDKVELSWTTYSEKDNKGFSVRKSKNGSSWETISWVDSKAESGTSFEEFNYNSTDHFPSKGINYYRVDQIDLNGNIHLSEIRSVIFGDKNELIISPNPVTDIVNIQFAGEDAVQEICLMDINGNKVLFQGVKEVNSLDMSHMTQGIYLLRVMYGDGTTIINKIVKL